MDNYVLRHLLGKHGRCLQNTSAPVSVFTRTHYVHGLAKLLSFDYVLPLGKVWVLFGDTEQHSGGGIPPGLGC